MNIFFESIQQQNNSFDDTSVLSQVLTNRQFRHLAEFFVNKLEESRSNYDEDLLCIFAQNYLDEDISILETIIKKSSENASLLLDFRSDAGYPADIAWKKKKFGLLTVILNAGGKMNVSQLSKNMRLAFKASRFNIKLDVNDVEQSFDYRKLGKGGLSIFELMAYEKDSDILNYIDTAQHYLQKLKKIALEINFFELIEAIFTKEELTQS